MAKEIHLEIVTPKQIAFSSDVLNFTVPGVVGPFEVLFNHAPIVSALQAGELKYTDLSGKESIIRISGGFLELHANQGVVLADGIIE